MQFLVVLSLMGTILFTLALPVMALGENNSTGLPSTGGAANTSGGSGGTQGGAASRILSFR